MKYTKRALSFEEQADLLLNRGLQADRDDLIKRLSSTSYFRLSGYLYPFRENGSENYREGTSLDQVWALCRHLLNRISPANQWTKRVFRLFSEFPYQPLSEMGLPRNWQDHPLWKP